MLPRRLAPRLISRRILSHQTTRPLSTLITSRTPQPHHRQPRPSQARYATHTPPNLVHYFSSKSLADEKIEEITDLFSTAQDEFEIAMEETQANTVYAEDDRKAAREEFDKVAEAYKSVMDGPDGELAEEVKRRIGQRIRELEQGVKAMEELAMNQD